MKINYNEYKVEKLNEVRCLMQEQIENEILHLVSLRRRYKRMANRVEVENTIYNRNKLLYLDGDIKAQSWKIGEMTGDLVRLKEVLRSKVNEEHAKVKEEYMVYQDLFFKACANQDRDSFEKYSKIKSEYGAKMYHLQEILWSMDHE